VAGWPPLLAVLLAGASSISPEMRQLGEAMAPDMLSTLMQTQAPMRPSPVTTSPYSQSAAGAGDQAAAVAITDPAPSWPVAATTSLRGPQKVTAGDLD